MVKWFTLTWIVGLFTLVPYGTYYLFFVASREQYALLITSVLFWVFGYWGIVGPLIAAVRVRKLFKTMELVSSREEFLTLMRKSDSEETLIDLIASENNIPRFMAKRLYRHLRQRLAEEETNKGKLGL